jgi:hypothetical protein
VILYPQHNKGIRPGEYTKEHVEAQIAERIQGYLGSAETREPVARFFREWRRVLERVQIQFLTWEQVVADMSDADLDRFYELCQRFNRANQGAEGAAKQ